MSTIKQTVQRMSREDVVSILEQQGGYQCHDHEPTEDLKKCLADDIERELYDVDLSAFEKSAAPTPRGW